MTKVNDVFAERLAKVRNERKIPQKTAAEGLGLSQALLSHYEKGIRECGLDFLKRASSYYGVSVDYFLGVTDDEQKVISDDPDEIKIEKRQRETDKHITGSVLPVVGRKLIFNGVNVLYHLLSEIGSNELTQAVNDDILLAVYNCFREVYSTDKKTSDGFFGVNDGYYVKAVSAREKSFLNVMNAAEKVESEIDEQKLIDEFGSVISSVNNIIANSESKIAKESGK